VGCPNVGALVAAAPRRRAGSEIKFTAGAAQKPQSVAQDLYAACKLSRDRLGSFCRRRLE